MADELLIYGSYGYTGQLVAREAVERGRSPVLGGRRAEPLEAQATTLDLDRRVFSLEHPHVIEERVAEFDAVLNCAGPFSRTADRLVSACIETGTDYLDIAGEIDVLEAVAERDREAERADVTLLPAVGFDVVPTDCLAAHVETRLPSATHLAIAIDGMGTFSPGTLKSIVEGFTRPGAVREEGTLREVPPAYRRRRVDLGQGAKPAVTVPWGDISTAYYTTGIGDIETYATVPAYAADLMERTRDLAPLMGSRPVRWALESTIDRFVSGPTAEERANSVSRVWAEATDDEGGRVAARLRTPDTYDLTAETAVESARRVVDGDVADGFQTPASAFGPDYVLEFDGVAREDATDGVSVPVDD
ncbi:saccharopine dehydrogenase family protein [Candidatus Halobonum tyrrellensis]|uniref:Saccharopine dehydrogenase NADP binding domain-containing protein n=1 Tax=Candidatus Halobonum tyrrellensis G22 TaxID=1324957 RepID=V4HFF2_9EURY|nr:saccharopine dehydrogenase NADP-binding domain-containing protein [Candidatus Halobonum tyrrellensis]ESP88798.1 hypothetical protein K933_07376 [Candidatus Halobonum tyrrellensis G22]